MKKLNVKRVVATVVLAVATVAGGSVFVDVVAGNMDRQAEVEQRNLQQHIEFGKQQRSVNSINK